MLWSVVALTFFATALIVLAMMYALSSPATAVQERLRTLWDGPAIKLSGSQRWTTQKERVEQLVIGIGKFLPSSPQQDSRTARMMARAGYRKPESVLLMRGIKVLFPVGLASAVYFTGVYHFNPMLVVMFTLVLGYLVPEFWLSRRINRRKTKLRRALPDALDLLVICVEAGLGIDQGMLRVAEELRVSHPELSDELHLTNMEVRVGKTRLDALRALGTRTGVDDIKALVAMLVQTDRFGTSVAQSLRVHSDDMRLKRRQRAEEMAAKTTVKMVPPLVFFIFPALMVVILGPAVVALVRQLMPTLSH
ncbi:MAG TPA: type II secretion system F family protein [Terriglobales bacterium]|nr:type II secretion system F family protein [Terriglobales bacterium]